MELRILMNALVESKKIRDEQQAFWELFEDTWGPIEYTEDEQKCLQDEVDNFIIDKIAAALKECNNNRTHTADKLGIKRETLLAKMRKYCL
tara:strand:- start:19 stop:291 length:273 start_codon:yes stop_codon:yes gene_type:complete